MNKNTSIVVQKKYWDQHKNKRGYAHSIVNYFATQRINFLKQIIDFKKIHSAFEVGCGDGFSTFYMLGEVERYAGCDISEHMIKCNPAPREKLIISCAESIPVNDKSYDLVYCWEVLHHVEDPLKAISEMKRISKKYIVMFEPNRDNILQFVFGLLKREERGTLSYSKEYLMALCNKAEIDVQIHMFCGCIFPNMTPTFIFNIVRHLPFKLPRFIGISNCHIQC